MPEVQYATPSQQKLTILVVDDELIQRLVLAKPLSDAGHTVVQAVSGNQALKVVSERAIDLILLDLGMKDGDGFYVLESLLQKGHQRWCPIVVISGHQSEDLVLKALDLGADDFMTKPVHLGFLHAKVRNYQRVIALQSQNLNLLDEVISKQADLEERMRRDFEFSSRIQKILLFGSIPRMPGGMYISARARAAQGVNGDFIEIISIYPNTVDIIVGDVMGKGPLAAIMGADMKLQIQRQISGRTIMQPGQKFSVSDIVNSIHQILTPKLIELETFITMSYIRLDRTDHTITATCCGHMQPVVLDQKKTTYLGSQHVPLGISIDEVYEESSMRVSPGAAVVCYSDGVTEARNGAGELFGDDGLLAAVEPFHLGPWGANALIETLHTSIETFLDGVPPSDDLTLVAAVFPKIGLTHEQLRISRKVEKITELRKFLNDYVESHQVSPEIGYKIELATIEAFTNITRHSVTKTSDPAVDFILYSDDEMMWVLFEYSGEYFDPIQQKELAEPSLDNLSEGGFGLHIINSLTKTLEYKHASGINRMSLGFSLTSSD